MTVALLALAVSPNMTLRPFDLRCEALSEPLGIGSAKPRLSWKLASTANGLRDLSQQGFRILVAHDKAGLRPGRADLWDSGLTNSSATADVEYGGKPLGSNEECWWSVQVVDQDGTASGWSSPAHFSTGLLSPSDWRADWIGFDAPRERTRQSDPYEGAKWLWPGTANDATFMRKITVREGLERATLRLTADDMFKLSVDGQAVTGTDGKDEAWRRPITVDLTGRLSRGEHEIRIDAKNVADRAGVLAALELRYKNGSTDRVVTDRQWQTYTAEGNPLGAATEEATYGEGPWGRFTRPLDLPPPRLLRHDFQVAKPVRRATLYGTAFGLVDLHLNGRRVANDYFTPGWTDYEKRVYARAYDVTKSLKPGTNALGAVLGDGWYSGYVGYGGHRDLYGTKTRARVQLEIEYTDGTRETVGSSPDWQATTGPMEFSDFLMGETYDARREQAGWDAPGFAAQDWSRVDVGATSQGAVEPFPGQPVRPFAELRAKRVTEPSKGVYLLDLGQNMAGFARLRLRGAPGQRITLRFGERLNPDGTLYTTNLRGARAIDTYVCRGGGTETWTPSFTFHGFQYIEVSGLGHRPSRSEVVGVAVSSDTPRVGQIETSDPMLNKLVSNAWWTQRMNFIDIPTDCPQRDERLGWTGDAQAYIRTASMLADVHPFFTKWLVSLDDAQRADGQFPMVAPLKVAESDGGPAWADAGVICPWTTYDVYGDRRLLAEHYPQMRKFVDFYVNRSTPDLLPPERFHAFGDWLNIDDPTPPQVIYEAYFAGSARLVAQAARQLGYSDDAAKYEELYNRVRRVFQKNYTAVDGVVAGDSQCAYVLALAFDLLDEPIRKMAADHLVEKIEKRGWHLSTGFVGTRDIMQTLSKIGRNDVAFRLLHNTTFPSWGFEIKNGATSVWERWDGWTPEKGFQDPGMNSFAHYAFGAVVGWMMAQPAGIDNLTPGFTTVRIAPQIDPKLRWLRSSYDSVRGKIVSDWKVEGDRVTMHVVVPPNVRAEVHVPGGETQLIGSGDYTFIGTTKAN